MNRVMRVCSLCCSYPPLFRGCVVTIFTFERGVRFHVLFIHVTCFFFFLLSLSPNGALNLSYTHILKKGCCAPGKPKSFLNPQLFNQSYKIMWMQRTLKMAHANADGRFDDGGSYEIQV
jgi:hypothetical protein